MASPSANLRFSPMAAAAQWVKFGAKHRHNGGKSLMDYTAQAMLYQPCAALSSSLAAAPVLAFIKCHRRCRALRRWQQKVC